MLKFSERSCFWGVVIDSESLSKNAFMNNFKYLIRFVFYKRGAVYALKLSALSVCGTVCHLQWPRFAITVLMWYTKKLVLRPIRLQVKDAHLTLIWENKCFPQKRTTLRWCPKDIKKTMTMSITKEECWKNKQNNIKFINADVDNFWDNNWSESANYMNEYPMWISKLNQCNQNWWICKQKLIQDVFV